MQEKKYLINGKSYTVILDKVEGNVAEVNVNGKSYMVTLEEDANTNVGSQSSAASAPVSAAPAQGGGKSILKSPLPGSIISIDCKVGDVVKEGQKIIVLEAMKMENSILADKSGTITEILVQKGDTVLDGANLLIIS